MPAFAMDSDSVLNTAAFPEQRVIVSAEETSHLSLYVSTAFSP